MNIGTNDDSYIGLIIKINNVRMIIMQYYGKVMCIFIKRINSGGILNHHFND